MQLCMMNQDPIHLDMLVQRKQSKCMGVLGATPTVLSWLKGLSYTVLWSGPFCKNILQRIAPNSEAPL